MTLSMTIRAAEEMGVSYRSAVMTRLRFLMQRIKELERRIYGYEKVVASAQSKKVRTGYEALAVIDRRELNPMKAEATVLQSYINGKVKLKGETPNEITPQMVENARNFPIEELLEQQPKGAGKVVCCPFHEDSSPSARVKHNHLVCFAGCKPKNGKKGWNPISLLMERDGLSFPAAVRALQ